MKLQCPRPEKAEAYGCLDITDDGYCTRNEWSSISYFKGKTPNTRTRAEVYCDRIKAVLHEADGREPR